MSLGAFLRPFMVRLYEERPDLPTPEARTILRQHLEADPDVMQRLWDCADQALGSSWASFCGDIRREAERMLSRATIERTPYGLAFLMYEQSRLPLPDAHRAPLIRNCTLALLREADQYLAHYEISFAKQRARLAPLIEQMAIAVESTGNPDLQVHEAEDLGFLDWETFSAM